MYIFEHFPQIDVSAPFLRDLAAYAQERIRRVAKLPIREQRDGGLPAFRLIMERGALLSGHTNSTGFALWRTPSLLSPFPAL